MIEAAVLSDDVAAILSDLASAGGGCGCKSDLLRLMNEDAPIYRGKGSSEVERLRAFVMVGLAKAGFADALMPYAIEELETGTSPYPIAAAARVARAASVLPQGIDELIVGAIDRLRGIDEFVHFDSYPAAPGAGPMTASAEAIKTLAIVGPKAKAADAAIGQNAPSCCAGAEKQPDPAVRSIAGLFDIELQNQDGKCARFGELFGGRASLIAFFYTRCMNPDKCSRTISQLADVHRMVRQRLPESTAMIAGVTYDPDYDLPERLRRYGTARKLPFGEQCQLFRSTGSFATIRDSLQLGVGYGSSTVNRHRIELLLVDQAGGAADANVRRLWDAQDTADALVAIERKALPTR
jgi:cytochrome oxidase Cu insertion factor (SCO1/SenC/PrrC family)